MGPADKTGYRAWHGFIDGTRLTGIVAAIRRFFSRQHGGWPAPRFARYDERYIPDGHKQTPSGVGRGVLLRPSSDKVVRKA